MPVDSSKSFANIVSRTFGDDALHFSFI